MDSDHSEQTNPTPSAAPSPILKKPKTKKQPGILPDFRLSFPRHAERGRSNVSICQPLGLKQSVSSKFYTIRTNEEFDMDAIDDNIRTLYERGPKQKYKRPITDNHNYGWNPNPLITDRNPEFNFAKDTSFMAQFRILEIALDEKMQLPKPKQKLNKK